MHLDQIVIEFCYTSLSFEGDSGGEGGREWWGGGGTESKMETCALHHMHIVVFQTAMVAMLKLGEWRGSFCFGAGT